MKSMIIFGLFLIAACDPTKVTRAREYNCMKEGQRVHCSELSSSENKNTVSSLASTTQPNKIEISVPAEISLSKIEILESAEETLESDHVECSLQVFAGQVYKVKIKDGNLHLQLGSSVGVYQPTEVADQWMSEIIEDNVKMTTILTIENGQFKSSLSCIVLA